MRFTESEISFAIRLRGASLQWEPHPGHFVFDIDGLVKAGSPFQAGVHFINSTNEYAALVGADKIEQYFVWLPTWEDARAWLQERGVGTGDVLKAWHKSLDDGRTDREILYGLMLNLLLSQVDGRT